MIVSQSGSACLLSHQLLLNTLGSLGAGTDFEPGGEDMGPRDKAQQFQSDRAGSLAQGLFRGKHTAHNLGSATELLPHSICHNQTCGYRL